jgi:hypothetical protein
MNTRNKKSKLVSDDPPICGYFAKVNVSNANCKKYKYPFRNGEHVLIFGEIAMMPGHCVFVTKEGKVFFGYHTDNFTPLTEEEV